MKVSILVSTLALCALSSCQKKGEVNHYQVEKTKAAPHAAVEVTQTAQAPYTWTLPAGWSAKPASGMRLATIVIPANGSTLEASVTEFGGDLAGNINRWRGQLGMTPLPEAEVISSLEKVQTGLGDGYIAQLVNKDSPEKAMLAAIIPRPSGTSVFVKLSSDAETLNRIAPAFTQFTQSISQ
ncbi:hypothetical protein HW115_04665 [Verrucomicrobiaceae bacterium N1E253]|uniref:PsbP C-terminal domain-containing protein n=1 Tax=Oceaniferula marina TaxID=2748318 RepID=A0A851GCI6_9BACT|nr:hypothetical protein [Oceaniferula marina]NWK54889.1 hypothetical protein [Oceaniferula marina]